QYDDDLDERDDHEKDGSFPSYAVNGWNPEWMDMKNVDVERRPVDEGIPELAQSALEIAKRPVYSRQMMIDDRALSPFDEIATQRRTSAAENESTIHRGVDDKPPARKRMVLSATVSNKIAGEAEGRITRS
ncbi:hypothetical protein PMAYCL1PPCAC_07988, partial [Pristionchus mayeri]